MDASPTATAPPPTAVLFNAVSKAPESEPELSSRIQPVKPLTFTNGVLKRLNPLHRHQANAPAPAPAVAAAVAYKECLKNHAAAMGGHAVDGCGEFMPSPNSTPADPTSLKCAACGCHRNFHRREPEEPLLPPTSSAAQHVIEYQPHHRHRPPPPPPPPPLRGGNSSPDSPSPPPISSSYYPSAPHMLLALSAGGLSGHPPENKTPTATLNGRKRFRTRFTQDQKEKMYEFAERVGWKFQKRDDNIISEFCSDVGVDRGVLKVWMHNNKNTLGKKDLMISNNNNNNNNGNGLISMIGTTENIRNTITTTDHHQHHHHYSNNSTDIHVLATNGSSSSS